MTARTAAARAPVAVLWLLLCSLPVVFAVWYVQGFSLVVPQFDHWTLLAFYTRVRAGEATLHDFFAPHNGLHVIFFARLVLGALAFLTHWNFRIEVYVGLSLVLLTAWFFDRTLHDASPDAAPETYWVVRFFTLCLLFSPVEERIWTWSVGFFHFFENALVAGAIWALCRSKPRFWTALALCTVMSFNRLEGLLGWVVFCPAMLGATAGLSARRLRLAAWSAGAAVSWGANVALILQDAGALPAGGGGITPALVGRLLFATSLIGMAPSAFAQSWFPALAPPHAFSPGGFVVLAVFTALGLRAWMSPPLRHRAVPFLSLGAFGIAFAVAASIGRAWLGRAEDLVGFKSWLVSYYLSAYSATSALVTVATVHLAALHAASQNARPGSPGRHVRRAAVALGGVCVVANYVHALPHLVEQRQGGRWDRYCVELAGYFEPLNVCTIRPEAARLLEASKLREIRHDVQFSKAGPSGGMLEQVRRWTDPSTKSAMVTVSGWADLPDEAAGTVLLSRGERRRFLAAASRLWSEGHGMRWSATLPAPLFDASGPLHAWAYVRSDRRFHRLGGEADPSARQP